MMSLDETKVKFSNLTRINSIKNSNYCENLINDSHLGEYDISTMRAHKPVQLHYLLTCPLDNIFKFQVRLSSEVAIQNGLKLLENCFEVHRVNLDPSSGSKECTTVYRPIDKFKSVLPHLIGSDKWKECWNVGVELENPKQYEGYQSKLYQERSGHNFHELPAAVSVKNVDNSSISSLDKLSRQESVESLAKSSSSIGDQMIINKPVRLFEEFEEVQAFSQPYNKNLPKTSFFQPQQEQRKIVNLFDDEPPSLPPSPTDNKQVDLFNDLELSDTSSLELPEKEVSQFPQPVDLFNDEDFEVFIKNIEKKQDQKVKEETSNHEPKSKDQSHGIRSVSEKITKQEDEIFYSTTGVTTSTSEKSHFLDLEKHLKSTLNDQSMINTEIPNPSDKNPNPISMPSSKLQQSVNKRVTNLFEDDDESEDYFNAVVKQKTETVAIITAPVEPSVVNNDTMKPKVSKLFDDEVDDEIDSYSYSFDEFSTEQPDKVKKKNLLFDENTELLDPLRKDAEFAESLVRREVATQPKETAENISGINNKLGPVLSLNSSVIVTDAMGSVKSKAMTIDTHKEQKENNQQKLFDSSIPFLNEEPPNDDEDDWKTVEHFDENENHRQYIEPIPIFTAAYSHFPLLNELPPDDDFIGEKPAIPEPNYSSDDTFVSTLR